ncbi:MAG: HAD family hydrolase, partial [Flavobacteriales bacterium]|nr:HAD family hydrolase [Flavobacteriales bacterium]
MIKKYEHIFFDLDRTLWHFDENSKNVLHDIFSQFSLSSYISNAEEFIESYQIINEDLWEQYRKGTIEKEQLRSERFYQTLLKYDKTDRNLSIEIGDYYLEHSPKQTTLLPFTVEVLDYLKEKYI